MSKHTLRLAVTIVRAFATAPLVAVNLAAPAYAASSCTVIATKPWKSGNNVFYSATTGTCVADYIKINLIWSKAGPDVTMATRSVANVKNVSDSRICNWGLPQNRNLKTDAFTPGSQHKTGTVTVTSYGSNC